VKTGAIVVPVFFFVWAIVGPTSARAQDAVPGNGADPFSPPVHSEEIRVKIDLIRADYVKKSEEIDREAERLTAEIVAADDPAVRERLVARLSALEGERRDALSRALAEIGDLRVRDARQEIEKSIASPPPSYMNPQRLFAAGDLSDLFGPEVDLSGYLRVRVSGDVSIDNPYENLFETSTKVKVALTYPIGDKLLVYLSAWGRFNYMTGGDTRWDHEIALDEAYVDLFFDRFDVRIGNQIVGWGRTDVINPTDNINPIDLTSVITGDVSEKKVPTPALKLDYYLGNTTAEVVVIPFFQEHKYDLVGSDFSIFRYGLFTDYVGGVFPWAYLLDDESEKLINRTSLSVVSPNKPSDSPENIQGGMRISSKYRGWDFSLSYLNMYDRLPTVELSEGLRSAIVTGSVVGYIGGLTPAGLANALSLDYHRYHMVGLDFATTWGSWGIRGEGALFLDRYTYTTDLDSIKNNYLLYVVGVDRLFANDFYVNLQFVQKAILDWGHNYVEDEFQSGLTLYTYKEFELFGRKIVPEVRALYDINGEGFFITPKVTYKWTDDLEFCLGMNIFEGKRDSVFGYFTDNDQAFFEIKYIF
jgi:hypothetical protein